MTDGEVGSLSDLFNPEQKFPNFNKRSYEWKLIILNTNVKFTLVWRELRYVEEHIYFILTWAEIWGGTYLLQFDVSWDMRRNKFTLVWRELRYEEEHIYFSLTWAEIWGGTLFTLVWRELRYEEEHIYFSLMWAKIWGGIYLL